jgi:hypothetical protein
MPPPRSSSPELEPPVYPGDDCAGTPGWQAVKAAMVRQGAVGNRRDPAVRSYLRRRTAFEALHRRAAKRAQRVEPVIGHARTAPRARPRRVGARRAGGVRSGQDPGSKEPHPEPATSAAVRSPAHALDGGAERRLSEARR